MANNNGCPSNGFIPNDTFHTPSFGDEDFGDLDNLGLSLASHENDTVFSQGNLLSDPPLGNMSLSNAHHCTSENSLAPKFPSINFEVPDISMSIGLNPIANSINSLANQPNNMSVSPDRIDQSNMNNVGNRTSPPGGTSVKPRESSSDDSDDSLPLAQLAQMKRQAASAAAQVEESTEAPAPKKQKTPKKKKKKDPNEPQKPVSAYALFFRDTQAAIKGQNPNATFGDVSKIVASMWDSLDPENKDAYKKKTELAKKEYLKQLAAYRASVVSQGAMEDAMAMKSVMNRNKPQQVAMGGPTMAAMPLGGGAPHHMTTIETQANLSPASDSGSDRMCGNSPNALMGGYTSPPHSLAMTTSPPHMGMSPVMTTSPPHMGGVMNSSPSHPMVAMAGMNNSPTMGMAGNMPLTNSPPHTMAMNHMTSSPPQGVPGMKTSPQHPMMNANYSSPVHQPHVTAYQGGALTEIAPHPSQMDQHLMDNSGMGYTSRWCVRNGCTNTTVDNPQWDNEYCSNDCVVSHCRDVFTAWVASRQSSNGSYPVK